LLAGDEEARKLIQVLKENKRQRVLLHVGVHKSGTTSLQNGLFCHEHGFIAPWYGEAVEHFLITHRERFEPAATRAAFEEAVKAADPRGQHIPVLSHEALCRPQVQCDAADRLAEAFPDGKVLIGIREQRSAIRSHYGHVIAQGTPLDLERFLGSVDERAPGFAPPFPLERLEYHLLVQRYVRLFGADRVKVLPFELLKQDPIAYQQQVHDFAGTGKVAESGLPRRRGGAGPVALALRRRLNRWVRGRPDWDGVYKRLGLPARAKNRLCRIVDRYTPQTLNQRQEQRLREIIADRVGRYYEVSNRELNRYTDLDLRDLGYMVADET